MEIFAIFIALLVIVWIAEAISERFPERMGEKFLGVVGAVGVLILVAVIIFAYAAGARHHAEMSNMAGMVTMPASLFGVSYETFERD